ncbi:MAG: hypothetical protein ACTSV2_16645 [Candidatus Thorarchaeota archaeon]
MMNPDCFLSYNTIETLELHRKKILVDEQSRQMIALLIEDAVLPL